MGRNSLCLVKDGNKMSYKKVSLFPILADTSHTRQKTQLFKIMYFLLQFPPLNCVITLEVKHIGFKSFLVLYRNVLRRLYSTMLLHFSPLKFPKSVTKLQIPFMFTSFCLSKFNHHKCSKLFLDKLILNLNCFKRANIDIFCLKLLLITLYISIINNK